MIREFSDKWAFVGNGTLDDALFRFPFSTRYAAPFWIFGSAGLSWSTVELPLRRDLTKADRSISCGSWRL